MTPREKFGNCKHGEFILLDGCPECIAEALSKGLPAGGLAEAAQAAGANVTTVTLETVPIPDSPTTAIVPIAPELNPSVMALQVEVTKARDYALKRTIVTHQDNVLATNDLALIADLDKQLEVLRNEYLAPYREHTKDINTLFKSITDPLAEAKRITKDKQLVHFHEQERIQREAENAARLQREADEAARRVRTQTGEVIEQTEAPVYVPPPVTGKVHADFGTSGIVKRWKWEVIDFTTVPDKYKTTDDKPIQKVIEAGGDIPGIRAWQEDDITTRRR